MKYAEVLLPLPLANTFTYRIPEAMDGLAVLYCRVVAPFGKKHYYTGIVTEIHDRCPSPPIEVKELLSLLDTQPVIEASQIAFWRWVSSYYLCALGEVYRAALPTGLKIESKSMKSGYKPKTETYVRLADHIQTAEDLHHAQERIKRAGQQERLFTAFLEMSGADKRNTVSKKVLMERADVKASVLNRLIKLGILVTEEKEVSRIDRSDRGMAAVAALSEGQEQAYTEIIRSFDKYNIALLHGNLTDGQTKIYIRLIQDALNKGLRALFLLPEIDLATQTTDQLKMVFGSKLFIYHSGISDNERVEIWKLLLQSDEPLVVLGTRSSLFLPFGRLGLIIMDEEHHTSYKQQDPAPRYHARNAAMMLARQLGAKTLLGSATPSLESYLWAKKDKYGYVMLDKDITGCLKPRIEVVNVNELRRKKLMKESLFSPLLKTRIDEALSKGEQVVIFQNRRGFAPLVACKSCGTIPRCVNCDVSLAYHKQNHRLSCHYCGYSIPFPLYCPSCSSAELKLQGYGTEQIEEEVTTLFPSVRAARLDFDTARTESVSRRILNDFEERKIQLLIGTQMVSKGLHDANVSVVGIINADALMNIPDFRAYERAFQLMCQVSGFAGGHERQGWVIVQTKQAENELLRMMRQFDYQGMAQTQLKERQQFSYPPYTRLILLILRGKNERILDEMAEVYAQRLKSKLGDCVSGPVYPPVTRLHTLYVRKIMLKIKLSLTVSDTRKILEEVQSVMQQDARFKQIIMYYDVDPQ